MALSSFNPLTILNDLRDNGVPEAQAQAVVRGYEQTRDDLVTRKDIELLQANFEKMFWRGIALLAGMILAATGAIIGALAAFGS